LNDFVKSIQSAELIGCTTFPIHFGELKQAVGNKVVVVAAVFFLGVNYDYLQLLYRNAGYVFQDLTGM
jgi:hypothetical protein